MAGSANVPCRIESLRLCTRVRVAALIMMAFPKTPADVPFVVVRLRCDLCPRQGRYRLARLVARFGADADLDRVRRELATPCHRLANKGTAMRPGFHVEYIDLCYGSQRQPDLPPGY